MAEVCCGSASSRAKARTRVYRGQRSCGRSHGRSVREEGAKCGQIVTLACLMSKPGGQRGWDSDTATLAAIREDDVRVGVCEGQRTQGGCWKSQGSLV